MRNVISSKKGFTLIELLAVIVIIGILMAIAIPSMGLVITNARKDIYVNSALTFINEAEKEVLNSVFEIDDPDTTYYIHIANLVDNRGNWGKSGFAEWSDSYVVATMSLINSKVNTNYYYNGVDRAGWKITLVERDKMKAKDVYQDTRKSVSFRPVGTRSKVIVYDKSGIKTSVEPEIELSQEEAKQCFSFQYKNATTAKLTFYNTKCGTDVVIPSKIEGRAVDEIYSYAFNNKGLTNIMIPSSVKTIGYRAFAYNKLTTVIIPASVTTIDGEAFRNQNISKLSLEKTLQSIGARAFQYNKLSEELGILVPGPTTTIGTCAFCNNNIPNASFIYARDASGKYDYTKVTGYIGDLSEFPDKIFKIPATKEDSKTHQTYSLKTIGSGAFERMALSNWKVIIPDTVTTIENSAFSSSSIGEVNLTNNVKTIGKEAFYNNKLKQLQIPSSVTSIGAMAFNVNSVTSGDIWIYKRTTSGIDYSTIIGYSGASRNNITVPTQVNGVTLTTLGESAFRHLSLKGTLKLPAKIKYTGTMTFEQNRLTKVDNGDGNLTDGFIYGRNSDGTINNTYLYAYGGINTQNVMIPNTIVTIGPNSFSRSYIKSVTIPDSVTAIKNNAFDLCQLEGTVVIPKNVTQIGSKAFYKEISWVSRNGSLTKIVNKTGKSFNWQSITGGPSAATFETGVIENWYGDITVTNE